MADPDQDRSEAATPFKLEKARARGQVARSAEWAAALVFGAAMVFVAWQGLALAESLLRLCRSLLGMAGRPLGDAALWPLLAVAIREGLALLLPFLGMLMLVAVVGSWLNTGVVFSFDPLKPDLDRIHPAQGLRRMFSRRILFDALRAGLKLAILSLVAGSALKALLPRLAMVSSLPPAGVLRSLVDGVGGLGLKMALALGLLALLDWAWSRFQFARQMRMSLREVKDEHKHREGDPRIRARLRELRREALKRSRSLARTREADVVLTNPTRYAVALRYQHGEMEAPRLLAKGAGPAARLMREIAARHRIPVVCNPPLARALFRAMDIDALVPSRFHAPVARIIVWVMALREQRRAAGAGAGA